MNALRLTPRSIAIGIILVLAAGCGAPNIMPPRLSNVTALRPPTEKQNGYTILYSFSGRKDGDVPVAGLTPLNGTLYGTTQFGGNSRCYTTDSPGCGTIFAIEPSGRERVIYRFQGNSDGLYPMASLVERNGTLYGTTASGGNYGCGLYSGCGTLFAVMPSGKERVIYRFGAEPDAAKPRGSLLVERGELFGTTSAGGAENGGAIFAVNARGKEDVITSFSESYGAGPQAGLVDNGGTFYGTVSAGGAAGDGLVFAATEAGSITTLHTFTGAPDGAHPIAPLLKYGDAFYGTTYGGGNSCSCGTVFSVTSDGKERVLHRFSGDDGSTPYAGLTRVGNTLYGTTKLGGAHGTGSVFEITPTGKERVIHSFGSISSGDGAYPVADLLFRQGFLYGTTSYGGTHFSGTVFRMRP